MATPAVRGSLLSFPIRSGSTFGRSAESRLHVVAPTQRRWISRDAGRAIEMLGHAVEYLADEHAFECMGVGDRRQAGVHPSVEAIEILMACNRDTYFECPVIPPLRDRLRDLLRLGKFLENTSRDRRSVS